jgi:Flp pilus assembly protein TadD
MSAISIPISRSQKTFSVAMALLGAVAAAQILAAFFLYSRHRRESQPPEARPAVIAQPAAPSVAASAAPVVTAGSETAPRTSARPKAQAQRAPASAADTLLRAARSLRERGDTTNAIAKLQQAAALEPENAEVLAELALTYESMQLLDRANDAWRRLQTLCAAVGPLNQQAQ